MHVVSLPNNETSEEKNKNSQTPNIQRVQSTQITPLKANQIWKNQPNNPNPDYVEAPVIQKVSLKS